MTHGAPGGTHRHGKAASHAMGVTGDPGQPFRAVPQAVESGHHRKQHLCGTDVRGGFLAADMLLASLQGKTVGHAPAAVLADADKPSRDRALVCRAAGKEGGMWPAIAEVHAKPLRRTENHVGPQRARGFDHRQSQQVACHDGKASGGLHRLYLGLDVAHLAAAGRIADQRAETSLAIGLGCRADLQIDADRLGPRAQYGDGLRMRVGIDPEDAGLGPVRAERHRHAFGGGCRLVEQRAIRDVHAGQFKHHRLEIQDGFKPALRDFRLVGRIGGIPGRVFQHVAQDHRRGVAIIISHADHRGDDPVPSGNGAHFVQHLGLGQWRADLHLVAAADIGGDDLVEEFGHRRDPKRRQHGCDIMLVQPDMTGRKGCLRCRASGRAGLSKSCFQW